MSRADQQIREQRALLQRMDRGETTLNGGTMDCKIYGCTKEAAAKFGPYAGLCDEHTEIARRKNSESRRGGGSAKPAATNGSGLVDDIRSLIPLARRVDRARTKLERIPAEANHKHAIDEAMRRYQGAPTDENLDRLKDAVQQATKKNGARSKREKAGEELDQAERAFKQELAAVARRAAS